MMILLYVLCIMLCEMIRSGLGLEGREVWPMILMALAQQVRRNNFRNNTITNNFFYFSQIYNLLYKLSNM
jgi:hypothetical protein